MTVKTDLAPGEPVPESPLVPNSKLRHMYKGMVESRLLEDFLRQRHKKSALPKVSGQEACRISALIDLEPDDLPSDTPGSITTAFLRGTSPADLDAYAAARSHKKKKGVRAPSLASAGLLPSVEEPQDRIAAALGAALAIKQYALPKVVVLFVEPQEAKPSTWRRTLKFAAHEELPILFVLLPQAEPTKSAKLFDFSGWATSAGTPGIPIIAVIAVDANDPIALYRVAQESIGRARSGGGSAVMECIQLPVEGHKKKTLPLDPIAALGQTLVSRRVYTQAELAKVASDFQGQLSLL